mgnify:FL=1
MKLRNEKDVDEKTAKAIREIMSISSLSGVVDKLFLDDMLYTHSIRVSKLATQLGITMNLSDELVYKICVAGLLHDLGKVNTPKEILYKPGKLTEEEFEIIKEHPIDGYNFCKQAGVDDTVCNMVLKHHVKKNSKGYPEGYPTKTTAENIITVADIFCALSEKRTYHSALEYRQALDFIDSFDDLNKEVLKALRQSFDD